ncbi:MAG: hypothetical protein HKN47_08825, partial [Pirellulaceae bacterium]|nr:hypothetical protein [Pirellulaceae bacterium]
MLLSSIVLWAPAISAALPPQPAFVGALVSGSTHYNVEQLSELYVEQLGETLTSELIDSVVERIEQKYITDGYFRPSVSFDDQLVLSGVVGIVVTEAAISTVAISGDRGPYAEEIDDRLEILRASNYVDRDMIVKFVRDVGRLPGLDVDAAIRSGADGGRELRLDFDYRAIQTRMQASNRGIEELGRNILFARLRLNGVLGWSETLDLYGAASTTYDRYSGLGLAFGKYLGAKGTRVQASAFASVAEPSMSTLRTYDRM